MGTSQLAVYNAALTNHLGQRKLANLTENVEPRRALDDTWTQAVGYCLEQGLWNFASRTALLEYSPSISTDFGLQYAFPKPDDWVRTDTISLDQYFQPPLRDVADEQAYWFVDSQTIYVKYISNDPDYGFNLGRWSQIFADFVALTLAERICFRLTASESLVQAIQKKARAYKIDARSKDAMNQPAGRMPQGSWVTSRNTRFGRGTGSGGEPF